MGVLGSLLKGIPPAPAEPHGWRKCWGGEEVVSRMWGYVQRRGFYPTIQALPSKKYAPILHPSNLLSTPRSPFPFHSPLLLPSPLLTSLLLFSPLLFSPLLPHTQCMHPNECLPLYQWWPLARAMPMTRTYMKLNVKGEPEGCLSVACRS